MDAPGHSSGQTCACWLGACHRKMTLRRLVYRPQEEIIPFFQKVELSPESKDVFSCYLELAEKVQHFSRG